MVCKTPAADLWSRSRGGRQAHHEHVERAQQDGKAAKQPRALAQHLHQYGGGFPKRPTAGPTGATRPSPPPATPARPLARPPTVSPERQTPTTSLDVGTR